MDVDDWQVKGAQHLSQLYQTNLSLHEYPNLDLFIGTEWEQVLSEAWEKESELQVRFIMKKLTGCLLEEDGNGYVSTQVLNTQ